MRWVLVGENTKRAPTVDEQQDEAKDKDIIIYYCGRQ